MISPAIDLPALLAVSPALVIGPQRLVTAAALVAAVALVFSLWKLRRLEWRLRDVELQRVGADTRRPSPAGLRDSLTDLPTRHLFLEMLENQVAAAQRYGYLIGLVLFDVDALRAVNDKFGVEVGDQVIQRLARRLGGNLREADFLARLEGDLFATVLNKLASVEELVAVVQRLIEHSKKPLLIDGDELLITFSVGIASCPEDADIATSLLSRAETALEQARSRGGNNLQLFTDKMNRSIHHRMSLQQDLRKALDTEQMEVHYQPQCSLRDGAIVGCEAFVRWRHPEQGLLSAGSFIPLAEEIGLMPELGRWLIDKVCRQLALWGSNGRGDISIAMNVSVRQFQHDRVAQLVQDSLTRHAADPRRLHIELTETIAMDDGADVESVLPVLRELGVSVCLDDFGTGYSSLSFLAKYPIDVLKIDSSFVAGVPDSTLHTNIVRMTLSLAESLELAIVAEGVEKPEHLRYLRQRNCPVAQGYLLGRPVPLDEIEAVIRTGAVELDTLASPS